MKHAFITLFLLGGFGLLAFRFASPTHSQAKLYPALLDYLKESKQEMGAIPEARRAELDKIAQFV